MKNRKFVIFVLAIILVLFFNIFENFLLINSSFKAHGRLSNFGLSATSSQGQINLFVDSNLGDNGTTGGGAGGGGKTGNQILKETPATSKKGFLIEPYEINIIQDAGTKSKGEILLKNIGEGPLLINIATLEDFYGFLELETRQITIKPGETKKIYVIISAPENPGIYLGKISFVSDEIKKEANVVSNVRSKNAIFELSLEIFSEYKVIKRGNNLVLSVTIKPLEKNLPANVTIEYLIRELDSGREVKKISENVLISEETKFVKNIDISDLPDGEYLAGVVLVHEGILPASDRFSIRKGKPAQNLFYILLLILLILLTLAVIIWAILKYKKASKYKNT